MSKINLYHFISNKVTNKLKLNETEFFLQSKNSQPINLKLTDYVKKTCKSVGLSSFKSIPVN